MYNIPLSRNKARIV